jgi:glutamate synthase domain-containing protein 2/glutamate synthase domain-containing protein 1/glutamate synthase domain-containing protein 3
MTPERLQAPWGDPGILVVATASSPHVESERPRETELSQPPFFAARPAVATARERLELDSCGIGFVADERGGASRQVVELALSGLACVRHRGAVAADGLSGDGAGVLLPLPRAYFAALASEAGHVVDPSRLGVVFAFLDRADTRACALAQAAVSAACAAEDLELVFWRDVPIDESQLGAAALADLPALLQAVIVFPDGVDGTEAERRALRARRRAEAACSEAGVRRYFASWSFTTITYKALVISDRLASFYPDLDDERVVAPFVIFHSRFSTNTAPAWERAQPFRHLCHNGEINTIQGNEHRMLARGVLGTEEVGLGPEDLLRPVLDPHDSDSGKLDAALELLLKGGRDVRHVVSMLVPEAWEGVRDLDRDVRDYFRFHAAICEPWDGPAGLIFTDGRRVGASLDRNGLRPMRWQRRDDGIVVCCSEAGAVPLSGQGRIARGRLGPGEMLCVDPDAPEGLGPWQDDATVKMLLAARAPYGEWARDGLLPFDGGRPVEMPPAPDDLLVEQAAFGCNREEIAMVLKPMATDAKEPTFSMGDDTPFAAVATRPRSMFNFLKQRFAQVSNPPIDHLRERLVMSLRTCLGRRHPLLTEHRAAAQLLELGTFFLYPDAVEALRDPTRSPFRASMIDATFPVGRGPEGLGEAIAQIRRDACDAVAAGATILVVSDAAIAPDRAPIPSLLALGAVHHALVARRIRQETSLVVDSGDARDTHSIACLLGYGADAICPRVALETVAAMADDGQLGEVHSSESQAKLQAAIEDGVLKILSKMGISTVDGYRGAQIFEALGLGAEVVETCLRGTPSTVGGLGFAAIGAEILARHATAFADDVTLDEPGFIRYRKRGGEYHGNNPELIKVLHASLGLVVDDPEAADEGASRRPARAKAGAGKFAAVPVAPLEERGRVIFFEGDRAEPLPPADPAEQRAAHLLQRAVAEDRADLYEQFRKLVEQRPVTELHDLLELVPSGPAISIDDVEPIDAITRRFSTGAMSHGALSAQAHETLAIAMNMIGGKSNCGEGGEDPARYRTRGTARDRNSRIKQIASGRFGVTPEYCAYADELNIKMAQGSKPGEGGQLPGHKVSREIARLRFTQPGVGLISPPPHHDIYSIEDLAQLIYDLKQVNPQAQVSVKLVAEHNVGTIAAGVAKALAEVVQISGANGGTGASPMSSIKNAGLPWELGLAETQWTLIENGLRDRVRVRVDGGFKTGRDVVIAALLGADEYSFGTAAMLAEGCIMVRACHRDTCPTGIATQRPGLRAKFAGTPEGVATYMCYVAEEVRELLASLGLHSLDDAIGRVECLRQRSTGHDRADSLDLAPLLRAPEDCNGPRRFVAHVPVQRPRSALDARLLADAFATVWEGGELELDYTITNADRTVGASLGGAIGLEFGELLPPGSVTGRFSGSAGQSFGAFLADGVTLELTGEAQDYVGKGMGGGRVVVKAPADDAGDPVLAGNTVLYGATGGQLFVQGRVGERFCVRNSGAVAVVEGAGDHACEYMTGGTVVILGDFGYNLGAGMTGGQAFVYDPEHLLVTRLNAQLVDATLVDDAQAEELRFLVECHRDVTGSERARTMLDDWDAYLVAFWRVAPVSEVDRIERANEGILGAAR